MIRPLAVSAAVLAATTAVGLAWAAAPPEGTLAADGARSVSWKGSVGAGSETLNLSEGAGCFSDGQPDPTSGCDFFKLNVTVPDGFYKDHPGVVQLTVTGFGQADVDLYVYRRNTDGSRGDFEGGDGDGPGADENVTLDSASGSFWLVVTPYVATAGQAYEGVAELKARRFGNPLALNAVSPPGLQNFRASRDRYTSHSEPTIAMDPLNHDHLMAASKMYENNAKYLFKVGSYESLDGGRTWTDLDHLPGYCQGPGQCDPNDDVRYRVTSDPSLAFDDEGNVYANVLDALGGTNNFRGFNMTAHVKRPGQPWSQPIVVHDNRREPVSEFALLDDKNWIAVDNVTDVNGGPNKPRDRKVGTIYVCWSFDGTGVPGPALTGDIPLPAQQIVLMRSLDGGRTWGGAAPGDNTPLPVSQKTAVSGIGCHTSIGPAGEVYITWYDNQLPGLMQAKSTDRGRSFTPAYPIALIQGVDDPFESEAFRNLSIPSSGVDASGNVYVVAASRNGQGTPVRRNAPALGRKLKQGELTPRDIADALKAPKANDISGRRFGAGGDGEGPESGADIVLFKSVDGGMSWAGPIRVNQDPRNGDADQFQPWLAVTPKGQLNISYFDRRNDPDNYLIDTWLSRSNDGGKTFTDTRVSRMPWDAAVNAPTSVSGKFIGDYQGLVADDEVAIPFWNDTQLNSRPRDDPQFSPYQEVFAARVPNGPLAGGAPGTGRSRCLPASRAKIGRRGIGRVRLGRTRRQLTQSVGRPERATGKQVRYCVRGGGRVLAALSLKGRVRLVATNSLAAVKGIRRGSRAAAVRRAFPDARRFGGKLLVSRSRRLVFGVRSGRVRFVAVTDPTVVRSGRTIRFYLRRIRLQ